MTTVFYTWYTRIQSLYTIYSVSRCSLPVNLVDYTQHYHHRLSHLYVHLLYNHPLEAYLLNSSSLQQPPGTMQRGATPSNKRTYTSKFVLPPSHQLMDNDAHVKNALSDFKKSKADVPRLQLPSTRTFLEWSSFEPAMEYRTLVVSNLKMTDDTAFFGIIHYLIHELGFPISLPTPQDLATFRAAEDARTCSDLPAPTASRVIRAFALGRPGYEVRQGMGQYMSPLIHA